jgi:hypothetical protein
MGWKDRDGEDHKHILEHPGHREQRAMDTGQGLEGMAEEVFIVSGRLYDAAFGLWLEAGHYASRRPPLS